MGLLFGEGSITQSLFDPASWWDTFKNGKNRDVAEQNLAFQRENLDYQKALQQQIFQREDTAYQRTKQDMLAAGLNPLSMQGTNGAGEVISTESMHNDFQDKGMAEILPLISSVGSQLSDIKTGSLSRDALQLENDKKRLDNLMQMKKLGLKIEDGQYDDITQENERSDNLSTWDYQNEKYDSSNKWYENQNTAREYEHKLQSGKYDTDSDMSRMLTDIEDWTLNGRGEKALNALREKYPLLDFIIKGLSGLVSGNGELESSRIGGSPMSFK